LYRGDRPAAVNKRYVDVVVFPINGLKDWPQRRVDATTFFVIIMVQSQYNAKATRKHAENGGLLPVDDEIKQQKVNRAGV